MVRSWYQLVEVVPVIRSFVCKLTVEFCVVESVKDIPQLQQQKLFDEGFIARPSREVRQVVDVTRFAPLIACAQLLRDKFWLCEAGDACRREFHLGKVQLLDLLVPDQWKPWGSRAS